MSSPYAFPNTHPYPHPSLPSPSSSSYILYRRTSSTSNSSSPPPPSPPSAGIDNASVRIAPNSPSAQDEFPFAFPDSPHAYSLSPFRGPKLNPICESSRQKSGSGSALPSLRSTFVLPASTAAKIALEKRRYESVSPLPPSSPPPMTDYEESVDEGLLPAVSESESSSSLAASDEEQEDEYGGYDSALRSTFFYTSSERLNPLPPPPPPPRPRKRPAHGLRRQRHSISTSSPSKLSAVRAAGAAAGRNASEPAVDLLPPMSAPVRRPESGRSDEPSRGTESRKRMEDDSTWEFGLGPGSEDSPSVVDVGMDVDVEDVPGPELGGKSQDSERREGGVVDDSILSEKRGKEMNGRGLTPGVEASDNTSATQTRTLAPTSSASGTELNSSPSEGQHEAPAFESSQPDEASLPTSEAATAVSRNPTVSHPARTASENALDTKSTSSPSEGRDADVAPDRDVQENTTSEDNTGASRVSTDLYPVSISSNVASRLGSTAPSLEDRDADVGLTFGSDRNREKRGDAFSDAVTAASRVPIDSHPAPIPVLDETKDCNVLALVSKQFEDASSRIVPSPIHTESPPMSIPNGAMDEVFAAGLDARTGAIQTDDLDANESVDLPDVDVDMIDAELEQDEAEDMDISPISETGPSTFPAAPSPEPAIASCSRLSTPLTALSSSAPQSEVEDDADEESDESSSKSVQRKRRTHSPSVASMAGRAKKKRRLSSPANNSDDDSESGSGRNSSSVDSSDSESEDKVKRSSPKTKAKKSPKEMRRRAAVVFSSSESESDDEEQDSESGSESGSSEDEEEVKPAVSKRMKRRSTSSPPPARAPTPPPPTTQPADTDAESNKELTGMLIETLAGSRSSSMTVKDIWRTLSSSRPSLRREKTEGQWTKVIKGVLEEGCKEREETKEEERERKRRKKGKGWLGRKGGVFGKVECGSGGGAGEVQYFYVPENDPDRDRAEIIQSLVMTRPGKRAATKVWKRYYWAPVPS